MTLETPVIPKDTLMSPKDVALLLDISTKTLSNWRAEKTNIPFYRVGRHIRYRKSDVLVFLGENREEVSDEL